MDLSEARKKAAEIAQLLLDGAQLIGKRRLCDQSLFATLSVSMAAKKRDINALDPGIKEVILFGSTARNEPGPGDIDLMVLDSGFYSNILCPEMARVRNRYGMLEDNLERMLDWFDFPTWTQEWLAIPVDLHVLPVKVITEMSVRSRIARQHRDPQFFENAFSKIERYDAATRSFVPTTEGELQSKYRTATAAPEVAHP